MYTVGMAKADHYSENLDKPIEFMDVYIKYPLAYTYTYIRETVIMMFHGIWACLDTEKAKRLSTELED